MIEKAMQRLGWRLGSGKPFQANKADIDAYNEIVEYVESKQKKQLTDNQLFGKLYIYVYGEMLKHYKATVFDNIPQKELHKILNKDLRVIVEEFKEILNDSERYAFWVDAGLDDKIKHPLQLTEGEKNANFKKVEEQMKKEGKKRFFGEVWSYEDVAEKLRLLVNGALNEFK